MNSEPINDQSSPVTFRFRNIGPVKDAGLGLGRLTLIAGRNNTGKTYIAYSLYGVLKTWQGLFRAPEFLVTAKQIAPGIAQVGAMLRDGGRAALPLSPSAMLEQRKLLLEEVSDVFSRRALPGVFSSRREHFRESSVTVGVYENALRALPSPVGLAHGPRAVSMAYDGAQLIAVEPSTESGLSDMQVARAYVFFLLRDLFPDPFILSAERFGISLFYRELDFTKNQLVDLLQKLGDEGSRQSVSPFLLIDRSTSRYALPIKDNIDFTRSIPDMPRGLSALADGKLSDDVKNLINGYYGNATDDIRFISKARGEGRSFNIPLHLASSSARGLSDLYFYLRHTAARDQLLIIDEPESHLDTRNQVLFARMLAGFVTSGLRVLVSTHSDYLVKELNNLIMLGRDFPEKEAVAKKLGYRVGVGLDPQSVRAYVAEGGGLTECEIGAFGIEMPVFDETIDEINRAAIELSSRAEEGS